jgi:hypothetical protein
VAYKWNLVKPFTQHAAPPLLIPACLHVSLPVRAGLATLRQGLADVQRAAREADPRGLSGVGDLLLRDDLFDIMAHNPVLAPCIVQADFMAAVQVFIEGYAPIR